MVLLQIKLYFSKDPKGVQHFEWDMGHWPILSAHHHFGLG